MLIEEKELEEILKLIDGTKALVEKKDFNITKADEESLRNKEEGIKIRNEGEDGTPAEGALLERLAQIAGVPQISPQNTAIIAFSKYKPLAEKSKMHFYDLGDTLKTASKSVFDALNHFDKEEIKLIICQKFEEKGLGLAIINRLKKAAGG